MKRACVALSGRPWRKHGPPCSPRLRRRIGAGGVAQGASTSPSSTSTGVEKGLELLPALLQSGAGVRVGDVTAYASVDSAVEALRRGAFDYLQKPFPTRPDSGNPGSVGDDAAGLRDRIALLEDQVKAIGPDTRCRQSKSRCRKPLTWLFRWRRPKRRCYCAASGAGKGVLARAIHAQGERAARPFVTIHCRASPRSCWRATCSAIRVARSAGGARHARQGGDCRGTLFSGWDSATSRYLCSPNCCVCCKTRHKHVGNVETHVATFASLPRLIAILKPRLPPGTPGRPLLSPQRHRACRAAVAAAPRRGHPAVGQFPAGVLHRPGRQGDRLIHPRGGTIAAGARLAGQHARVAQRLERRHH